MPVELLVQIRYSGSYDMDFVYHWCHISLVPGPNDRFLILISLVPGPNDRFLILNC